MVDGHRLLRLRGRHGLRAEGEERRAQVDLPDRGRRLRRHVRQRPALLRRQDRQGHRRERPQRQADLAEADQRRAPRRGRHLLLDARGRLRPRVHRQRGQQGLFVLRARREPRLEPVHRPLRLRRAGRGRHPRPRARPSTSAPTTATSTRSTPAAGPSAGATTRAAASPGAATIVGDIVYFSSFDAGTTGLDVQTGKVRFRWPDGRYTPVISDGKRIYLTGYAQVYGLEPRRPSRGRRGRPSRARRQARRQAKRTSGAAARDARPSSPSHVRHRRPPRPGRHAAAGGGAAHARGAPPPRPRRRGGEPLRPADARPHAAGDRRRGGRRPAALLRGPRARRGRERRDLQPARRAGGARARAGHRFATRSDCEVVVHAYEDDGPGLRAAAERHVRVRALGRPRAAAGGRPRPLRRQAALLVERRPAAGAGLRDRRAAGHRPGASREIDEVALDHYLACRFVPGPRTLFAGISKLPAASLLVADADGRVEVTSFREPPGRAARATAPRTELADELAERFMRRRRAPDDVRRPLRRLPQRRRRLGGDRRRHEAARPSGRPPRSRSASRATARRSTSASTRPRARG